jgi:hypothetical protein
MPLAWCSIHLPFHSRSTPGTLSTVGFFLAAIAAAVVYHSSENAAVDVGMAVLASAGIASMVGGRCVQWQEGGHVTV